MQTRSQQKGSSRSGSKRGLKPPLSRDHDDHQDRPNNSRNVRPKIGEDPSPKPQSDSHFVFMACEFSFSVSSLLEIP